MFPMNSTRTVFLVTIVLTSFIAVGCGSDGSSESQRVSMEEGSSKPSTSQSQQSSSPSSSIDVEAMFKKTGIYPSKVKTYDDGYTVVTLNGHLVVKKIQISNNQRGIVDWPVIPGEQGDENIIWFENFNLKKALDRAIVSERIFPDRAPELEITKIRANKYESGSLRGFMDITFNDALTANGIKLMQTDGEYWIGWPSIKTSGGDYEDLLGASNELKQRLIERGRNEMGL